MLSCLKPYNNYPFYRLLANVFPRKDQRDNEAVIIKLSGWLTPLLVPGMVGGGRALEALLGVTETVHLCANSGQAVSAASHPGGAWSGEGGRDRAGSARPAYDEAHATVSCLTPT